VGGIQALTSSPILNNLISLDLRDNKIGNLGGHALVASPNLTNLVSLDFHHHPMDKVVFRLLGRNNQLFTYQSMIDYHYHWPETALPCDLLARYFSQAFRPPYPLFPHNLIIEQSIEFKYNRPARMAIEQKLCGSPHRNPTQ